MKKVLAALALVVTIGFFGIQQADAQRGPMGWGGGPAGINCGKATAGQNVQVMDEETKKSYNSFMDATVDLRREMFSKREQMRALTFATTPDEEKIDALAKEMFDLRTQIQEKADEVGWQGGMGGAGFACGGPGRGMGMGMGNGMGSGRGGNGPCPKWN
ncbi:MAG: periplasmic heavy metal sensor [Proteobacteria bacterium]|nr:periplasmic heavy metal sensor [Pseudomonadota bacterium]MBU4297025.1 periplasmic heavy metal sensor [Pseudomonadota bacterium]MCG2749906.1 periplasmic heavy metal sensor [Desulfobulbaceae bacterium]